MSVNKRGEVILKLNDVEYKLVPSYENMDSLENAFDCGILEIGDHVDGLKRSSELVKYVHTFVTSCGHNVTIDQFRKQLDGVPLVKLIETTNIFLSSFMHGEEDKKK